MSDTESPQGVLAVVRMPEHDRTTIVEQEECKTVKLDKDQFDSLIKAIYTVGGYNYEE